LEGFKVKTTKYPTAFYAGVLAGCNWMKRLCGSKVLFSKWDAWNVLRKIMARCGIKTANCDFLRIVILLK